MTLDNAGNVSFVTIPEPSTVALAGIGAVALGMFIRRRKNQS
jgi:hypothetical protein